MLNSMGVEVKLRPGYETHISVGALVKNTTAEFAKMSLEKRQCQYDSSKLSNILNPMNFSFIGKKYHQSNCIFQSLIDFGWQECNCLPWYLYQIVKESK